MIRTLQHYVTHAYAKLSIMEKMGSGEKLNKQSSCSNNKIQFVNIFRERKMKNLDFS
jgi:hypothetical protein